MKHNNNTGRWITPFRPAWGPGSDCIMVGDMKRGVAVFDATTGQHTALMSSEYMTAIPSRLAVHPSGAHVMAAATSSGRVHVIR